MKFFIRLSMLLLFCLHFGCQSDDELMPLCDVIPISPCESIINLIPFVDTCFTLPPEPSSGWLYDIDTIGAYGLPHYNVENHEEFLYMESLPFGQTNHFYNLNTCSGEKKLIMANQSIGLVRPTWVHDDWIVFTDHMENVWKIKSNGDSLIQLTFEHQFKFPTPLPNKRLLFLERDYPEMPNVYRSVIMNMDGEVLDTLENTVGISDYYDGKLATVKAYEFFYRDLLTQEKTTIINLEGTDHVSIFDIYWLDEKHLIWYDNIGLHKVHIETGVLTTLVANCENRSIFSFSVSPDLNGIVIFNERHFAVKDNITLYSKHRIYKLDTNTGEQWEIDLSP